MHERLQPLVDAVESGTDSAAIRRGPEEIQRLQRDLKSRQGPRVIGSGVHEERHWTEEFLSWMRRGDRESSSGVGSTISATQRVRPAIESILSGRVLDDAIRTFLDLPCGDWNWMRLVDLSGVLYTGMDIVQPLIERNRRLHGGSGVEFRVFDLLHATEVPGTYDLALCRDLLGHFTPHEGVEMLRKLAACSRHLMVTTFPALPANDHAERSWYPCSLEREPFALPEPLKVFCEDAVSGKSLGLWRSGDVGAALRRSSRSVCRKQPRQRYCRGSMGI